MYGIGSSSAVMFRGGAMSFVKRGIKEIAPWRFAKEDGLVSIAEKRLKQLSEVVMQTGKTRCCTSDKTAMASAHGKDLLNYAYQVIVSDVVSAKMAGKKVNYVINPLGTAVTQIPLQTALSAAAKDGVSVSVYPHYRSLPTGYFAAQARSLDDTVAALCRPYFSHKLSPSLFLPHRLFDAGFTGFTLNNAMSALGQGFQGAMDAYLGSNASDITLIATGDTGLDTFYFKVIQDVLFSPHQKGVILHLNLNGMRLTESVGPQDIAQMRSFFGAHSDRFQVMDTTVSPLTPTLHLDAADRAVSLAKEGHNVVYLTYAPRPTPHAGEPALSGKTEAEIHAFHEGYDTLSFLAQVQAGLGVSFAPFFEKVCRRVDSQIAAYEEHAVFNYTRQDMAQMQKPAIVSEHSVLKTCDSGRETMGSFGKTHMATVLKAWSAAGAVFVAQDAAEGGVFRQIPKLMRVSLSDDLKSTALAGKLVLTPPNEAVMELTLGSLALRKGLAPVGIFPHVPYFKNALMITEDLAHSAQFGNAARGVIRFMDGRYQDGGIGGSFHNYDISFLKGPGKRVFPLWDLALLPSLADELQSQAQKGFQVFVTVPSSAYSQKTPKVASLELKKDDIVLYPATSPSNTVLISFGSGVPIALAAQKNLEMDVLGIVSISANQSAVAATLLDSYDAKTTRFVFVEPEQHGLMASFSETLRLESQKRNTFCDSRVHRVSQDEIFTAAGVRLFDQDVEALMRVLHDAGDDMSGQK